MCVRCSCVRVRGCWLVVVVPCLPLWLVVLVLTTNLYYFVILIVVPCFWCVRAALVGVVVGVVVMATAFSLSFLSFSFSLFFRGCGFQSFVLISRIFILIIYIFV